MSQDKKQLWLIRSRFGYSVFYSVKAPYIDDYGDVHGAVRWDGVIGPRCGSLAFHSALPQFTLKRYECIPLISTKTGLRRGKLVIQ